MPTIDTINREIARELSAERFDLTADGLYLPRVGALAVGEYWGRVNGGEWRHEGNNRIVTEGYALMLSVSLSQSPKPAGLYLAICSGTTAPADNWTAATYAATASEIVSMTEGHTGATRPVWTPPNSVAIGTIDNYASPAALTIATAGTLTVTGAAMLTNAQRGGTTGALINASLFNAPRTFQNGDKYDLGYRVSLGN